jgi:hypothetical protein
MWYVDSYVQMSLEACCARAWPGRQFALDGSHLESTVEIASGPAGGLALHGGSGRRENWSRRRQVPNQPIKAWTVKE